MRVYMPAGYLAFHLLFFNLHPIEPGTLYRMFQQVFAYLTHFS